MSDPTDESLVQEFHDEMLELYSHAKAVTNNEYRPTRFLQAVRRHGGVTYAKRILKSKSAQAGFKRLRHHNRKDITVESLVLHPKFRILFTDRELQTAENRLSVSSLDR